MRKRVVVRLALVVAALCLWMSPNARLNAAAPPAPLEPVPSPAQLAWQEDELTLFVHFGMNTFTGRTIGLGNEDPKLFNPAGLDCRQWTRVAKECGFKGIVLTAKHHDGFCLWPTATTEHSVRNSAWKDGKGDVVRELADACQESGVKLGIYCSPWDRNQAIYETDKPAYTRFYTGQLTELLSNYGPVYEMWFDGNRAVIDDWPAVIKTVRTLQPGAVIKQGPRLPDILEDLRWVGNPQGSAPLASWSVYPPPPTAANRRAWFPVECDTMMIGNWFWDGTPPRDLAFLLNLYYVSVGRNSILLLGVAPNKLGLFSEESVARLREFRVALNRIFESNFAVGARVTASNVRGKDPAFGPARSVDTTAMTYWATDDGVTNAWLEVNMGIVREFNVIRMEEMISLGQRVSEYKLEVWDVATEKWREVHRGFTIGYRKLDRIPRVKSSRVRLTILNARACPTLRSFGVHLDTVSPPEHFEPAFANAEVRTPARAPAKGKK